MTQVTINAVLDEYVRLLSSVLNDVIKVMSRGPHRQRAKDLTHNHDCETERQANVMGRTPMPFLQSARSIEHEVNGTFEATRSSETYLG